MNDPTFYLVGAYGVTAIAILVEIILLRANRRRVVKAAQAQRDLTSPEQS